MEHEYIDDDDRCRICGESNPAVLVNFHIIPPSFGGERTLANMVTLCANHRKVLRQIYSDDVFRRLRGEQTAEDDEDGEVTETNRSTGLNDRARGIKQIIRELTEEHDDLPGAPNEAVYDRAEESGIERSKAEYEVQKLRDKGEVFSPDQDHLRPV